MSKDLRPVDGPRAIPPNRAAALVAELCQMARHWLGPRLEQMYAACDDAFFDLASRAKSTHDQNLYFESLREIRLKRSRVMTDVLAGIERGFDVLARAEAAPTRSRADKPVNVAELKLVGHEQVEKDVLVTDMVARARIEWQDELYQLNERFAQLYPRLEAQQNPLDPGCVTAAFTAAAEAVDVPLRSLRILYKRFELTVLANLDELYQQANVHLREAGVLPELTPFSSRRVKKHESRGRKAARSSQQAAVTAQSEESGLAAVGIPDSDPEMQELAHVLKRLHDGGIRLPTLQNLPANPAGTPVQREELISLLSDIQLHTGQSADGAPATLDIRKAIETIVASRGQLNLGQVDEDIINVVAMFFDIILDDANLPLEIRALVSRLQIPVLKIALKDRSFFTNRKHPARQFINEIARTSIGLDAGEKDELDALFARLTQLVEQVLRSSADHAEVFEDCLNDLTAFIEGHNQRVSKLENRTRELAAAQARTQVSRDAVKTLLNQRLAGASLPQQIADFLVSDWQQVLYLRHLRDGEDSNPWREAVQILDDLIWSVQPHHDDEESLERLQVLLPGLYVRINAAMEESGADVARAEQALEPLKAMLSEFGQGNGAEFRSQPLSEEQKQQIDPAQLPQQTPWNEMTAVERQFVRQQELLAEHMRQAEALPVGTWLKYDDLRQGVSRRCKLSAKLAATDTFVFVNRTGAKIYEKPLKAFAYDLQMGYARVLDAKPFFDRTLERISSRLRKLAGE